MEESDIKVYKNSIKILSEIELAKDHNGNKYRYRLYRKWGEGKMVLAIMLNPSKADCVKSDNTVTNITNFFCDRHFKSLTILNLFSFMSTDCELLIYANESYEKKNLEILNDECEKADEILVGWGQLCGKGKLKKEYLKSKEIKALEMLKRYKEKTYCFRDENGTERHPVIISERWSYEKYFK